MIIVRLERWLAAAAFLAGTAAWIAYVQQDLILSHYDAKAHLVVARRVIDSITPGWQQLGAVWLPLPHLLQVVPVQLDVLYRTGAFGSLVSILSFTIAVWASSRLVLLLTGSGAGALTTAALLVLNPNLLYLQATPMTEPLLIAVVFLVVLWTCEWIGPAAGGLPPGRSADGDRLDVRPLPARLAGALFAAMWTRYEAWPVVAVAIAAAGWAAWRSTRSLPVATRVVARMAAWPLVAVVLFVINSRITVGAWFVSGGFYVPDPAYEGRPWRSLVAVWWGTHQLSGYAIEIVALLGAAAAAFRALRRREAAAGAVALAVWAAAALPIYAFYQGHPFRIRYMVPLVAASALWCGLAAGWAWRVPRHGGGAGRGPGRFARIALAALLAGASIVESPPLDGRAPLVEEAQWDRPRSIERRVVTACLATAYRGDKVMASMGSLAHYMQELSREGFAIADFLHEGNGVLWEFAMETGPSPHAGWMLVEEQAEGGDVLAQRIRGDAAFTRGMQRVCEGGGVALYRRQ